LSHLQLAFNIIVTYSSNENINTLNDIITLLTIGVMAIHTLLHGRGQQRAQFRYFFSRSSLLYRTLPQAELVGSLTTTQLCIHEDWYFTLQYLYFRTLNNGSIPASCTTLGPTVKYCSRVDSDVASFAGNSLLQAIRRRPLMPDQEHTARTTQSRGGSCLSTIWKCFSWLSDRAMELIHI
jgi:hypothetical protein